MCGNPMHDSTLWEINAYPIISGTSGLLFSSACFVKLLRLLSWKPKYWGKYILCINMAFTLFYNFLRNMFCSSKYLATYARDAPRNTHRFLCKVAIFLPHYNQETKCMWEIIVKLRNNKFHENSFSSFWVLIRQQIDRHSNQIGTRLLRFFVDEPKWNMLLMKLIKHFRVRS